MVQEQAGNTNGRVAEDSREATWGPGPQPDPLLAELIRVVQEAIEMRPGVEEEAPAPQQAVLPPQQAAPPRAEPPQRPAPAARRVRYSFD